MKTLLLIFLASACYAGPKYGYQDPHLDDELDNVYHDIQYPVISSGKATKFNAALLTVSTMTVSSATITNLSVTNLAGITVGKIKQMVKATTTSPTATTSSTYQNTGLTANITPSSSSSLILIIASCGSLRNTNPATTNATLTLARGGSNLVGANGILSVGTSALATGIDMPTTFAYVDSPASTSSLTYTVQVRSSDNVNSVSFNVQSETASIVLLEVL